MWRSANPLSLQLEFAIHQHILHLELDRSEWSGHSRQVEAEGYALVCLRRLPARERQVQTRVGVRRREVTAHLDLDAAEIHRAVLLHMAHLGFAREGIVIADARR